VTPGNGIMTMSESKKEIDNNEMNDMVFIEKDSNKDNYSLDDLLDLMKFLRSENGCPWDKEQPHQSIKKNVLEEAYEVVDAIDSDQPERLSDELGDLLLQVIFHSQMAKEKNEFDFGDVVDHLCKKLISRHTHLFGENKEKATSPEMVLAIWDKNKKIEKKQHKQTQEMKEIPRVLPALQIAYKIQLKAKKVGFDWDERSDVIAKISEEIGEVEEAVQMVESSIENVAVEKLTGYKKAVELEIGDLLFAVVNYSRFLDVNPEIALDKANQKFVNRFEFVEDKVLSSGRKMQQLSLVELDQIWEEAKKAE